MPDRRNPYDVPERIERLSRALDRVAAGQPAPVLDDAELQELVDLAGRLRREMPRDVPDPGFRAELKAHLTAGTWRDQRRPAALRQQPRHAAFPYRAAIGAITAVLVAAVAVGTLAIWTNADDTDDTLNTAGANQTSDAAPTQALALATSTNSDATSVAVATAPQPEASPDDTASIDLTSTTRESDPTATVQRTRSPGPTATRNDAQPTATLVSATSTPDDDATPTATQGTQLAGVPPVDAAHLEPGPGPAVDGGGESPSPAVAVTLDAPLPDLSDTAPLYTLTPPDVDPAELVEGVAAVLGIDAPVVKAIDARGKIEYSVFGANGAHFVWTPETGGFTFAMPESESAAPSSEDVTADLVVENTLAWLATIGYPADSLTAQPLIEEDDDGNWLLQIWTASVPFNSYGHPLGVIVTVNAAGQITGGTGFWLTLDGEEDVSILSAGDAWQAIAEHQGYWTGGGAASGGGEFTVDTLFLGYALTREDGVDALIYQPTIIAQGEFISLNGAATRITVYLQATE